MPTIRSLEHEHEQRKGSTLTVYPEQILSQRPGMSVSSYGNVYSIVTHSIGKLIYEAPPEGHPINTPCLSRPPPRTQAQLEHRQQRTGWQFAKVEIRTVMRADQETRIHLRDRVLGNKEWFSVEMPGMRSAWHTEADIEFSDDEGVTLDPDTPIAASTGVGCYRTAERMALTPTVLPASAKFCYALYRVEFMLIHYDVHLWRAWGEWRDADRGTECCAICYENEYMDAESVAVTECKHKFHSECLAEWFQQQRTCPMCRARIPKIHRHYETW